MEWIFDHIQLIFFIGAAIAYWLNQTRKNLAEQQEAARERDEREEGRPSPLPGSHEDPADRVRRIQEEIRRKIAERRAADREPSGRPVWADQEDEETLFAPPPPPPPPRARPAPVEPPPLVSADEHAASLARQRRLIEQLAEAERTKAAAKVRLDEVWDRPSVTAAKRTLARAAQGRALSVGETLRDRRALRRAWVLREVLDKPVSLR